MVEIEIDLPEDLYNKLVDLATIEQIAVEEYVEKLLSSRMFEEELKRLEEQVSERISED